jgi:hypothetical protein
MDTLIWVLLLVLLFLFFFWNPSATYDTAADQKQGVSPNIIQAIIESIQKNHPEEVPLETLFINSKALGEYSARFMFFNTVGYYGTQYDVQAKVSPEGSVQILNISASAHVDNYDSGFTPYKPDQYQDYADISKALDNKLQSELTNYRQSETHRQTNPFETSKVSEAYSKNINADADMRKFFSSEQPVSFSPDSAEPGTAQRPGRPVGAVATGGPSPVRSGEMLASGDRVFNLQ